MFEVRDIFSILRLRLITSHTITSWMAALEFLKLISSPQISHYGIFKSLCLLRTECFL